MTAHLRTLWFFCFLLHITIATAEQKIVEEPIETKQKTGRQAVQLASYFEIPVTDMNRAKRFYEALFGHELILETIDNTEMALFPDAENGTITGALAKGESYEPGKQGIRLYFSVENIDVVLNKVEALGEQIHYPKTAIGELGYVAEFIDTEGNIIALHQTAGSSQ